jgi:hypothetical protein
MVSIFSLILMNGSIFFWHGVVSMCPPGMTSADPFHSEPDPFKHTPFLNCFNGILRTGWMVAAVGSKEWRQGQLVNANR